jgi:hypothetical protein
MNILITSYYYYPELTPRAFRTYELVKEFLRCGHCATLFLPDKDCYQSDVKQKDRLKIVYVKEKSNQPDCRDGGDCRAINDISRPKIKKPAFSFYKMLKTMLPDKIKQLIKDFIEWKARYLYPLHKKSFIRPLSDALSKEQQTYDLMISIGLPVEVHIGTALGILKNKKLRKIPVTVADYGDPFSRSHVFFGYQLVDFFIARVFKYIAVPTGLAVSSYTRFKRRKNIRVIPQGFNLADYEVVEYKPNKVPTFAYAGCFYLDIRNPESLFDYLKNIPEAFLFIIYTIRESADTDKIINKYRPYFGDKLKIVYNTPRKELIKKLSAMDFLIDIKNSTKNQMPSKLIDYAIAGRPILSLPAKDFQKEIIREFFNGDYSSGCENVNINEFDIRKIANAFLSLR